MHHNETENVNVMMTSLVTCDGNCVCVWPNKNGRQWPQSDRVTTDCLHSRLFSLRGAVPHCKHQCHWSTRRVHVLLDRNVIICRNNLHHYTTLICSSRKDSMVTWEEFGWVINTVLGNGYNMIAQCTITSLGIANLEWINVINAFLWHSQHTIDQQSVPC